jgi:hypothetical protein
LLGHAICLRIPNYAEIRVQMFMTVTRHD